jgi:hypothetical protein
MITLVNTLGAYPTSELSYHVPPDCMLQCLENLCFATFRYDPYNKVFARVFMYTIPIGSDQSVSEMAGSVSLEQQPIHRYSL